MQWSLAQPFQISWGGTSSKEMTTGPEQSVVGRSYQLWSLKQQKRKNIFFQANNSMQRRILQFLKSFNVYFKIRCGNPAICPNTGIHQLFQVGVHQAKTSEGAPMPAVLLGLGYSQTPLTQFSCSCILPFFLSANHLWAWAKYSCQFGTIMSCETTTGDNRIVHVWMETEERRNIPRSYGGSLLPYISLHEGLKNLEVLWVLQGTQKWPALHHFIVLSFIPSLAKLFFFFLLQMLLLFQGKENN